MRLRSKVSDASGFLDGFVARSKGAGTYLAAFAELMPDEGFIVVAAHLLLSIPVCFVCEQ